MDPGAGGYNSMKFDIRQLRNVAVFASVSAVLVACGGGGGGSSSGGGTVPAPVAGGGTSGTGASGTPVVPADGGSAPGDTADSGGETAVGDSGGVTPEAPAPEPKSVVLRWEAPTTRQDGSCLVDLQAYRVSFGLAPGLYDHNQLVDVGDVACTATGQGGVCGVTQSCEVTVASLSTASWYFVIQAVDSMGQLSGYSNEVVRTVQ